MKENPLKAKIRAGQSIVNGWLSIPSAFSAELMARSGWDSITIDMQHGVVHYDTAVQCLQGMAACDVVPMVRVPWNEPGIIMKMIDSGAFGVICPMINDRAEAERFVGACRYPPAGYRSFGPIRSAMVAGADYVPNANEIVLTFAMIETADAMQNLDEIMSTDGLDGIYIGPSDLGFALGRKPLQDQTDEVVVNAIDQILATAKKHGLIAGLHNQTPEYAKSMIDKGFDLVTISSDGGLMMQAARSAIKTIKG